MSDRNLPDNPRAESPAPGVVPRHLPPAAQQGVEPVEAREGKLDAQTATRLASIVALAARMIECAELGDDPREFADSPPHLPR